MATWKQIKIFPKYEASDEGDIRNKETQKVISQKSLDKDGYPTVKLYDSNRSKKKSICPQVDSRNIYTKSR